MSTRSNKRTTRSNNKTVASEQQPQVNKKAIGEQFNDDGAGQPISSNRKKNQKNVAKSVDRSNEEDDTHILMNNNNPKKTTRKRLIEPANLEVSIALAPQPPAKKTRTNVQKIKQVESSESDVSVRRSARTTTRASTAASSQTLVRSKKQTLTEEKVKAKKDEKLSIKKTLSKRGQTLEVLEEKLELSSSVDVEAKSSKSQKQSKKKTTSVTKSSSNLGEEETVKSSNKKQTSAKNENTRQQRSQKQKNDPESLVVEFDLEPPPATAKSVRSKKGVQPETKKEIATPKQSVSNKKSSKKIDPDEEETDKTTIKPQTNSRRGKKPILIIEESKNLQEDPKPVVKAVQIKSSSSRKKMDFSEQQPSSSRPQRSNRQLLKNVVDKKDAKLETYEKTKNELLSKTQIQNEEELKNELPPPPSSSSHSSSVAENSSVVKKAQQETDFIKEATTKTYNSSQKKKTVVIEPKDSTIKATTSSFATDFQSKLEKIHTLASMGKSEQPKLLVQQDTDSSRNLIANKQTVDQLSVVSLIQSESNQQTIDDNQSNNITADENKINLVASNVLEQPKTITATPKEESLTTIVSNNDSQNKSLLIINNTINTVEKESEAATILNAVQPPTMTEEKPKQNGFSNKSKTSVVEKEEVASCSDTLNLMKRKHDDQEEKEAADEDGKNFKKLRVETGDLFTLGSAVGPELGRRETRFADRRVKENEPGRVKLKNKVHRIAVGALHTLAITENGEVISFGCNDDLALGRFLKLDDSDFDGNEGLVDDDDIDDLEEKLSAKPLPVDGLDGIKAMKVTAGDMHSAVLSQDGRVFIWGNFKDDSNKIGLFEDDLKLSGSSDHLGTTIPRQILIDKKVVDIASGCHHLVILTEDGIVHTLGEGSKGQLGRVVSTELNSIEKNRRLFLEPLPVVISGEPKIFRVFASQWNSYALTEDGALYGWGLNNYFQLGFKNESISQANSLNSDAFCQLMPTQISVSFKVTQVANGQQHVLLLDSHGQVYSCGSALYGKLGHGENFVQQCGEDKSIAYFKKIDPKFFNNEKIVQIDCGDFCSMALSETGLVYCWGQGSSQIGTKENLDLFSPRPLAGVFADQTKFLAVSAGSSIAALVGNIQSQQQPQLPSTTL